jgi:NAD(P)-dependent dehydrogenase (short-subunit alcohol dehydrogenase family)
MDLQLKGKRALVTGGTGGIGYAIAEVLAAEGATVIITGRSRATVDEAVASVRKNAGANAQISGVVADVGTAEGARHLLDSLPEVEILVNNLGIYESKPFPEITDEDWLHLFEVNVLSGIRTARAYLPKMLARNWGRIIFISSESGIMIPNEMIHYGMTKTAQLAVSRGLAEYTKNTAVTVNTVMPGPTKSAGVVDYLRQVFSEPEGTIETLQPEFFEKYRSSSLLQRFIDPKEIAYLVAYVASPLSAATNGAALRAEGGLLRSIA